MAAFNIKSILGDQSQPRQGQRLDVVMIPIESIRPNPRNTEIYLIGDVSSLAEDIKANGLRQPLEVVRDGSAYRLIGGERRWTAMKSLQEGGDFRFDAVPCIIRPAGSEDDELLDLITANSTARELTDGERLAQYEALKEIFERKKAAGEFEGRVRDKLVEVTGMSAGALGRMNAISANCTGEVKQMLRDGRATLTKCYEASKLWPRQQADFITKGYASALPGVNGREKITALNQFLASYMHENGSRPETAYNLISWVAEKLSGRMIAIDEDVWLIRKVDGSNMCQAFLMESEGDATNMIYLSGWDILQAHDKMFPQQEETEEQPEEEKKPVGWNDGVSESPGGDLDKKKSIEREKEVEKILGELLKYGKIEKYWDKYTGNVSAEMYLNLDTYRHIFDDGRRLELAVDNSLGKNPAYDSNDDVTVAFSDEFGTLTAHANEYKSITLTGYLAASLTLVSKKLMNNAAFDVLSLVIARMAESYAQFFEKQCLKGESGKTTGALAGVPEGQTITAASATAITGDDLIDVQDAIPDVYQMNAIWIMSRKTRNAIRKLKNKDGDYLLNKDMTTPWGYMLLGHPVFVSENMDDIAASKEVILYGDMSGLAVKESEALEIQVLREKYAEQHAVGVLGWSEIDTKVENAQKLSKLKMAEA